MKVQWTDFKAFAAAKGLSIQWIEDSKFYYLKAFDGAFSVECEIDKNPSDSTDLTDFVNNYKSISTTNLPLTQLDTDGAQVVRPKAAKKGWSFWAVPIEITTSTLTGTLYCKDAAGTDIPGITCKIYNGSNAEITTAGLLDANLNTCVKTVLDFEPAFDYEIIGGALRLNSNPSQDVRMWLIGAPDIPAIYGGSKEFASGINLKFLATDGSFDIDGRVTKYIKYDAATHQGKLRILLKHPAGASVNMQFVIHLYRQ